MADGDSNEGLAGPYSFSLPDGSTLPTAGVYTGLASVQYTNGDSFEGEFVNGRKEGRGVYTYRNGDKFQGEYKNNKRTGLGRTDYSAGGFYHGNYENGRRSGEGTRRYANGDIYYGQWKDGRHDGYGTYIFNTTKYKFVGQWRAGQLLEGSWRWQNGTVYEGTFEMNKPCGEGTWSFANGTRVQGSYSQRVLPVDEAPDDDPRPAQKIELQWTPSGVSAQ
ncbi:UNVERIFIED_CONTAM: MORN repeat-containing protein [Hammondia hammondi]|eukprot:XP_008888292.1 MORN repeat-containing protein [Hammondia hammondi]